MNAYADTSFIVRLLSSEPGSDAAIAEFHSLNRPPLPFLSLHNLEVANAIRQRAFQLRHSVSKRERTGIQRNKESALARMTRWIQRGWLLEKTLDWELAAESASELSAKHGDRLSARSIDLLHIAFASQLDAEIFLTTDHAQGEIARSEGLAVPEIQD
jgi:predicted nucleic acid-binding protein